MKPAKAKTVRLRVSGAVAEEAGREVDRLKTELAAAYAVALGGKLCISEQHKALEAELARQTGIANSRDRAWVAERDARLRQEKATKFAQDRWDAERERAERQRIAHGLLDRWSATGGKCHNGSCPCCLVAADIEALRPAAPDPTPTVVGIDVASGPNLVWPEEQPDLPLGTCADWPCGHPRVHPQDELCRECSP